MTKRNLFLLGLLVALVGVWVFVFSGWFATKRIQIMHTLHSPRRGRAGNNNSPAPPAVTFGLDREYELIDIKVIQLSALKTNASPLPAWHLVSDSNSVPVKMVIYGQWLRGMKSSTGGRAQNLQPGEAYRLSLKAVTGESGDSDFKAP